MKRRFIAIFIATVLVGSISTVGTGSLAKAPASHVSVQSPPPTTPSSQPVATPQASPSPAPRATPATAVVRAATPRIVGDTLSIASLGLQARVIPVGLTQSNAIDVPAGPQVGYWTGSAKPGTPGAVFLDGHVDGVFAKLSRLSVDQTLQLSYGGSTFSYKVVHREVVQLAGIDMDRALSVYGNALEGLNIMTCAGTYIPSQGTYDQRLVVYATRLN